MFDGGEDYFGNGKHCRGWSVCLTGGKITLATGNTAEVGLCV